MRILILNWKDEAHPRAGGAEVFTQRTASALVARGHEVTLFASAVDGRPESEVVDGVRIHRSGTRLGVYRAARRFWERCPPRSFDVVIDEINTRPFHAPRWVRDTPVVALIHQLAREVWFTETPLPIALAGRYVLEPMWLRAYRDVPVLAVSESTADSLRRLHGFRSVSVIPEGLTPVAVPELEKEPAPTIVFLGRLVGMKRPDHAIRAFAVLRERFPDARLWVIGRGPLERRLRRAAPAGVEFLGGVSVEERTRRLARAHVLVATSVREGWGMNVSEAAQVGTPAIAYAVPGLVDSVALADGMLVEPTPAALGAALVSFFSGDTTLVPTHAVGTWDDVADAIEAELRKVVNAPPPRR